MSNFILDLYAELFGAEDVDELEEATEEWSHTTAVERSFAQVQLLWMIHQRLSELGTVVSGLNQLLEHLNQRPPDAIEVDVLELEPVDLEVHDG